jgi:Superfamily II DNA helicase
MDRIEFLKRRIGSFRTEWDILVLKRFPIGDLLSLGDHYLLLDEYVVEGGKIVLDKVDNLKMIRLLTGLEGQKAVITYESFIALYGMLRNMDSLGVRFIVLENNLLARFENPTNQSIPDFDSPEFQDENGNSVFVGFYSFCQHDRGKEFVTYIEPYLEREHLVVTEQLIKGRSVEVDAPVLDLADVPSLSIDDDSLTEAMEILFFEGRTTSSVYSVDRIQVRDNPSFSVFQTAARAFGTPVHFVPLSEEIQRGFRPELLDLLQSVWHYPSFRDLSVYRDPSTGKETITISQGDIIENVVSQAENAREGRAMMNILLTAPTGAGKSILFQLPAVYLAEKYGLLTIVVSPLVSLMEDQVEGLTSRYEGVATLNSTVSASRKAEILDGIQSNTVNLLYLAPELLLSYSLSTFIGQRKIGLFIVDEAHTVTTWGRDFRVDYWFLGDYLRTAKRYLGYSFPIFALTATAVWDPSGKNDMVFETIDSLNMDPCIKYIGVVKRENIVFDINHVSIPANYEQNKRRYALSAIHSVLQEEKKAIVYFPYVSSVNSIMNEPEIQELSGKVVSYHARLTPALKIQNARRFREGLSPVICATKAFGMGIDVPDVGMVYHYAPTGSLSDYVQEIGRLARDPGITGVAKIDFCDKDFRYSRTLHGLSAIRPYQLRMVLRKLMDIYHSKGEKRNMLVSAGDFAYIFPGDDVDYDQKLKSCLLLLSHDLLDKYGFYSLIVRPKSLFTKCFLRFVNEETASRFRALYSEYVSTTGDSRVLNLDCEMYWERHNRNISFASFKTRLAGNEVFRDFEIEIVLGVELSLGDPLSSTVYKKLESFFSRAHSFLDTMASTRKRMPIETMASSLPNSWNQSQKDVFIECFKSIYATKRRGCQICKIHRSHESDTDSFQLIENGYSKIAEECYSVFSRLFPTPQRAYAKLYCKADDSVIFLAEVLDSLGLATYQKFGGDDPAIFVRINNPIRLGDLVRSGRYENSILKRIYDRYDYSERVFTYFFTKTMSDEERWEFIENYFLGQPEELLLSE